MVFDNGNRIRQVESVKRDITNVGHLKRVEGRGLRVHPIGASHNGFGSDPSGAEAGTRAQAGANIQRNTEYGNVQSGCGGLRGQTKHGAGASKPWHFVAAQWLVIGLVSVTGGHLVSPSD